MPGYLGVLLGEYLKIALCYVSWTANVCRSFLYWSSILRIVFAAKDEPWMWVMGKNSILNKN